MTASTNPTQAKSYKHPREKRANLATDETATSLDEDVIADKTINIDVEKSNYPRLVWDSHTTGGGG